MPNNTFTEKNSILVKGARVHNLKNINLAIPREQLIVVTGVSGSGKSSLAFDTLYAEGQRRYVESLSSYARQFLGRIQKPEVDYIKGIPPAIAIEQKVNTRNPRSTVGTSTEVYDYLRILFARIGKTLSPISGEIVKRHSVSSIIDEILTFPEGIKFIIYAPFPLKEERSWQQQLLVLQQQGFSRVEINGDDTPRMISDVLQDNLMLSAIEQVNLVVDRLSVATDDDTLARMADSLQTAFFEGHGTCTLHFFTPEETLERSFSNKFEADGIVFEEPSPHTFSFNSPIGACPVCEGFGKILGIDPDLAMPDKNLSVYQDGIACWKGEKMSEWKNRLIMAAEKFNFPIHKPLRDLSEEQLHLLWTGNRYFEGLDAFFSMLEAETYKIQYRVMLSRYRGRTVCTACKGKRLKKEATYIRVVGKAIADLVDMPIWDLRDFFMAIELTDHEMKIAKRLLFEIKSRLQFLTDVGLGYLTLNRLSSTLSGGESQRINLATSLGSSLVGSLYILDEPSIGLHSRDTERLIKVLRNLQQIGNTVLVVEHDEDIMRQADYIIDIGPLAGIHGGEVVFQGTHDELMRDPSSLTTNYLSGKMKIEVPENRRVWNTSVSVRGAYENNLKNVDVELPLRVLTVVTGVSGSGKSSLVKGIVYPWLNREINQTGDKPGRCSGVTFADKLSAIEFVDQNPIGKSSRSNPVTYIKAYDEIRKLFADQPASKINNFSASHFSFNVDGGRCEECQGDGIIKIEMQFMADVELVCESCKGKRFKEDVLDVFYREKNIHDILEMTVDVAIDFFKQDNSTLSKKIVTKLTPLSDVGLGYVQLGQASSTLSGGESQRIKLASFLGKDQSHVHTLFIFDEPTTGLHFHDIAKLLKAFNALIQKGNSVMVVEHNLEVIKSADWVVDLGPEGGNEGGHLVFAGTPENLVKCKASYTGKYLVDKLKG